MSERIPMVIDGGSLSGYAFTKRGFLKPKFGLVEMPDTKNTGRFCNAMAEWMLPFCGLNGINEIGVEAPIIVSHKDQRKGQCPHCGRYDHSLNIHEVDKLFGIVHAIEMAADKLGIPCERIPRSSAVLHIAGTGRGTRKQFKTMCLMGCQRKGWNITSEDLADAGAGLCFYTWKHQIEVDWDNKPAPGPIFATQGVAIDKSNEIAAARLVNNIHSFNAKEPAK